MKLMKVIGLMVMLFAAEALQAQGILFVQAVTRDGKSTTNQVQLDKTHMRAESASVAGNVFLFDSATKTARMINTERKTYREIDGSQMEGMRQQMAQLQEQLKNMPPQQRAMMEQMMGARGGFPGMISGPADPLTYRQAGSDKVGQWNCTKYEGFRGADKVSELCTVDPSQFGLTAADFAVAKEFVEFLTGLLPQMADQAVMFGTVADQGFAGVPVRQTRFTNGRVESVSEVKEFRRETFPPSTWEVPAGFQREGGAGR
jgi:hypothetical protein